MFPIKSFEIPSPVESPIKTYSKSNYDEISYYKNRIYKIAEKIYSGSFTFFSNIGLYIKENASLFFSIIQEEFSSTSHEFIDVRRRRKQTRYRVYRVYVKDYKSSLPTIYE